MPTPQRLGRHALVPLRWLLGMGLVSWRYVWQITPLHRSEEPGDATDMPPAPPEDLIDDRAQLARDGVGPLFHRTFSVRIQGTALDERSLMAAVMADFSRIMPSEVTSVDSTRRHGDGMRVGDELIVRMPGPWNAPVRVVACGEASFRLMTLRGHLEAGQIEFRARGEDNGLCFEIEAWARPSTRLVHVLYARVRLAKEMQLNMWVRCCLHAAAVADGRARDGVRIHTRQVRYR